jgi:hypothetical protein
VGDSRGREEIGELGDSVQRGRPPEREVCDPGQYKVEHAFARLGRWRRLSRCYEGTEASAKAWLEVVCVAYLFVRLRAEPT